MDPVTVVVTALVGGMGVVASTAVTDAYQGLKTLVVTRLRGGGVDDGKAESLVAQVTESTDRRDELTATLSSVGVDDPTLDAARQLLELLENQQRGKFVIDASGAKGVLIGDHSTQHNTFN